MGDIAVASLENSLPHRPWNYRREVAEVVELKGGKGCVEQRIWSVGK